MSSIAQFLIDSGLEPVGGRNGSDARDDSGQPERARDQPFWVDLERVTTRCGFSYATEGWHPYSAAVVEHARGEPVDPVDSILGRYFTSFSPTSAGDAILGPASDELPVLHDLPAYPLDFVKRVWELDDEMDRQLRASHSGEPPTAGNPHYGPASPEWIAKESDRLASIYESVRTHGYRPTEMDDGYVRGYFLVGGDDFRFVALEGNHRLGALRALGVPRVAVTPWRSLPIVDQRDLDASDGRVGAYFPREVTHRLFDFLFESNGFEKATKLGLTS